MLNLDLCRPPVSPSPTWLAQFALHLREIDPHYSRTEAAAQALHAHAHTWLLSAAEAALLWQRALLDRQRRA